MTRLIHPGLVALGRLHVLARLRAMYRRMRTVKGLVFIILSLLPFLGWLPFLFLSTRTGETPFGDIFPGLRAFLGPGGDAPHHLLSLAMLGFFMLMMLSPNNKSLVLIFRPAEIDFLLPGPFTRRQTLVYKITMSSLVYLPASAIFTVFGVVMGANVFACFAGLFLAFCALNLLGLVIDLSAGIVSARMHNAATRTLVLVLGLLIAAAAWHAASGAHAGVVDLIRSLARSPALRFALAPFDVFSRTITATRFYPEGVLWGSLALGINALLFGIALRLDADFRDAALEASRRFYENIRRFQRGGVVSSPGSVRRKLGRVPQLPRWQGAGPIAWHQLLSARRGGRRWLLQAAIMAVVGFVAFVVLRGLRLPEDHEIGGFVIVPIAGMVGLMTTLLISFIVPYDFKGDLDKMFWLKSLPVPSWAVALGQLITPVLAATSLHLVLAAIAAAVMHKPLILLIAAFVAPPFNLLMIGLGNAFFLLFPTRTFVMNPGDFRFAARMQLIVMLQGAVLMACLTVAAVVGLVSFLVTGGSYLAGFVAAWAVLVVPAIGVVPCVAWAFRRFDASLDVPV